MRNKKGFTLVEIIVVLVILAVLAATVIPAFLGVIERAKQSEAKEECRLLVMASKAVLTNEVIIDQVITNDITWEDEDFYLKSKTMAELDGEVIKIGTTGYSVVYAQYRSSNGYSVEYDINTEMKYKILEDEEGVTPYEKAKEFMETLKAGWSSGTASYDKTQEVQAEMLEEYNGEYPKINDEEFSKLEDENFSENDTDLYWIPVVTEDGEDVMMIASNSKDRVGGIFGAMVYYNNKYYYHAHSTTFSNKVNYTYVSDRGTLSTELDSITSPDSLSSSYWYYLEE